MPLKISRETRRCPLGLAVDVAGARAGAPARPPDSMSPAPSPSFGSDIAGGVPPAGKSSTRFAVAIIDRNARRFFVPCEQRLDRPCAAYLYSAGRPAGRAQPAGLQVKAGNEMEQWTAGGASFAVAICKSVRSTVINS